MPWRYHPFVTMITVEIAGAFGGSHFQPRVNKLTTGRARYCRRARCPCPVALRLPGLQSLFRYGVAPEIYGRAAKG